MTTISSTTPSTTTTTTTTSTTPPAGSAPAAGAASTEAGGEASAQPALNAPNVAEERDSVAIETREAIAERDRRRETLGLEGLARTAPMLAAPSGASPTAGVEGASSSRAARDGVQAAGVPTVDDALRVPDTAGRALALSARADRGPAPERLAGPATFDASYYLAHNPDLGAAGITTAEQAKQHWLQYGVDEGRAGCAGFDPKTYLDRYGDLKNAYGDDYRAAGLHYLDYGIAEGRSGAPAARPGSTGTPPPDSPLSLQNSNLQIFDPQNRRIGTLGDASHPSDWMVKQWHTEHVITPQSGGTRTDPELGTAQRTYATAGSALAVYDDPKHPGNPVYELATAGGVNTAYGAQNLFLQREPTPPIAVRDGAKIDLDYRVPYAQIQKDADFDGKNVGQLHLGMVFHNTKTGETMFIQKELYESNNTRGDAHIDGDPNDPNDKGTHAPLYATSGRPGEDLRKPPSDWTHLSVDLNREVSDALAAQYSVAGGGTYRLPPSSPSDWQLTAVYFGTETAGSAVLTAQVKNMGLTP